ncbi:Thiamin pyrophosphokinase 1 [Neolecta irregularis DAH-3]|uniref:Thiamine pyrophosphokinase n=1 Tax=Neolecta irregularis (strain DAH-3) TaxID=1198029 RepID=A0A1U7LKL8_NEOID|nr:Thiamin pyrophosphokinase 1 [Neolecta irregularis DAH-3]|eukprot:OLL23189.1 Thiamin pyrophosphokinase 1 [Neolecta irregularis DAH-3]
MLSILVNIFHYLGRSRFPTAVSMFSPASFIRAEPGIYGLIILNQPILSKLFLFRRLWKMVIASVRVAADGGGNRLYETFEEKERLEFIPEYIVGDLDSLKQEVQEWYQAQGTQVKEHEDQDLTDFDKSLLQIDEAISKTCDVVVLSGNGGRTDQVFANINILYRHQRRIFLITEESITFVVRKGSSVILTPCRIFGKTCGLIPTGKPSIISTTGLKWNLDQMHSEFGGMVSTSNVIVEEEVTVNCTEDILWTMELR